MHAPLDTGQSSVVLHVDLDALAANYRVLRQLCDGAAVAAVVKADAYGLGVGPIVQALVEAGCEDFFVSSLSEGLQLRHHAPQGRIFVLSGATDAPQTCIQARLVPVLNTAEEIRIWGGMGEGLAAAIQIDTGMTRAGLNLQEVKSLREHPALWERLNVVLVMSHLACADTSHALMNDLQRKEFESIRRLLPKAPVSLANSAGVLLGRAYHGDLVRPGLALYGADVSDLPNQLQPVVRLEARIMQIRDVLHDVSIGYGATVRVKAPARIATLGVGYADGYPRALGNKGQVVVAGVRAPVVGRVSMDLVTIDISAVPVDAVAVGDMVELYGSQLALEEVAHWADTINYEVLTRLSARIPRRYWWHGAAATF